MRTVCRKSSRSSPKEVDKLDCVSIVLECCSRSVLNAAKNPVKTDTKNLLDYDSDCPSCHFNSECPPYPNHSTTNVLGESTLA